MTKKFLKYLVIAIIWLGLWQIIAMAIGKELLFPSPISVAKRLFELSLTGEFYKIILHSLLRILAGMIIGTLVGVLCGSLTAFSKTAREFFSPALAVIKATPVASFIILIVLYISRDLAPLIIALMMVTPIVWTGVEAGILNTDPQLIEMAKAYKMGSWAKLRHIFIPSIAPYFLTALRSSLGMAWKAGIAAEVLLEPFISIGKMIADAKSYLETTDLFAWTVVVVVLSVLIEKIMLLLLKKALKNRSFDMIGGANFG